jgi:hypothetical protein
VRVAVSLTPAAVACFLAFGGGAAYGFGLGQEWAHTRRWRWLTVAGVLIFGFCGALLIVSIFEYGCRRAGA